MLKNEKIVFPQKLFYTAIIAEVLYEIGTGYFDNNVFAQNENKPQGVIVVHYENKIAKILR